MTDSQPDKTYDLFLNLPIESIDRISLQTRLREIGHPDDVPAQ